jgi:hypothetical protein
MTYKITESDASTNTVIEREATTDETLDIKAREQKIANLKTKAEARTTQRQAILDRLGLTSEEARLLLS